MYASFLVQKQHETKRMKQEKDSMQFLMLFFFFQPKKCHAKCKGECSLKYKINPNNLFPFNPSLSHNAIKTKYIKNCHNGQPYPRHRSHTSDSGWKATRMKLTLCSLQDFYNTVCSRSYRKLGRLTNHVGTFI